MGSMKRSRPSKETTSGGDCNDDDEGSLSWIDRLSQLDTTRVASEGRNDAKKLDKLQEFCDRLQASLNAVKKQRHEEVMTKTEEPMTKEKNGRMKDRQKCLSENACFECKKVGRDDALSPCCTYKHEGISGEGILVCEECREKLCLGSCSECNAFVCNSESSCPGICSDHSYTCKSCKAITCVTCAESREWENCECGDWYCEECAGDVLSSEHCCGCDEKNIFCNDCEIWKRLEICEGECNEPLCDKCVSELACGAKARLCGECNFDCDDCDICEGYYGSRWK